MPIRPEICPACSAPLNLAILPDNSPRRVRCAYCGTSLALARHGTHVVDALPAKAPAPSASIQPYGPPAGRSYWVWLLLTSRGRVGRSGFWLGIVSAAALLFLGVMLNTREIVPAVAPWLWLTAIYIAIMVSIKRARARGRPPLMAVLWLFPVIGPLLLLIDLGLVESD